MIDPQGPSLRRFLDRLCSRSELTDLERCAVLALHGHTKHVSAHVDFVRLEERVDHSCLVVDGLVGRFDQNKDGARQITCLYIPGDMADLSSVVSPKSTWGLSALTATTILCVPHVELRDAAARHPGVAEAFWRDCVADGSIFSEWVVNVGRRDATARLAHLLCEMGIRSERAGLGNRQSYALPITQSDLGDATGLTNVHVNRTLGTLRNASIVTVRGGKVAVHNWDKLITVGDFDEDFMLYGPSPRINAAA